MKLNNLFVKVLFIAAMVFVGSSELMAQQGGGKAQGAGKGQSKVMDAETSTKMMVTKLTKALDLTSDQQSKVSAIYQEIAEGNASQYEAKMKEIKDAKSAESCDSETKSQSTKAAAPNMFAQSSTDAIETEAKMKKILSDEQYTKWKEMDTLAETKKSMRPSGSKGGGKK